MRILTITLIVCAFMFTHSNGQVVINEIYPEEDRVELKNIGSTDMNLRGWALNDGGNGFLSINGNTTFICGQLALAAGEIAVVEVPSVNTSSRGQFMLQNLTGDPVSYVQWGVGGQSLSDRAVNASAWDARDIFISSFQTGGSVELVDETERRNPDGYLEQLDPTICGDNTACRFDDILVSNIQCNDAGTPSDPSDDYYTFVLQVEGLNLDAQLDLEMTGTTISPSVLSRDCIDCTFSTGPGSANEKIYALTVSSTSCEKTTDVQAPSSCSPQCVLTHQIINLRCNNNGTSSDPADDYLEYTLRVWGVNTASDEYIGTYANGIEIGPFEYGSVQNLDTRDSGQLAGGGDFVLFIEDVQDPTCIREIFFTDPGSCSEDCEYTEVSLLNVRCNPNGTSSDPSDDFLQFSIETEGLNLASEYIIESTRTEISPMTGSNLTFSEFSTALGGASLGDILIELTDTDNPECGIDEILVNPGTCSEDCLLTLDSLAFICNNNETPVDSTDDYYQLYINVDGQNTSDSFRLSLNPLLSTVRVLNYNQGHLIDLDNGIDLRANYGMSILDNEKSCVGITLNGQLQGPCSDEIVSIDNIPNSNIQVYPNPVQDLIYYSSDFSMDRSQLEIYGTNGILYISIPIFTQHGAIDLSILEAGIYIVKFNNTGEVQTMRLIKN